MKTFYLFCNTGYGESFYREFLRFADNHPGIRTLVVFSGTDRLRYSRFKLLQMILRYFHNYWPNDGIIYCENVNATEFITSIPQGSIGIVAGFNQIFDERCIARFENMINFHPSVLPYYRGAIPSFWALQNGETRTGFTAHRIVKKIDGGEILHQHYVDISPGMDEHELDKLIAQTASKYFNNLLKALASGQSLEITQLASPYRVAAGYMPARREG